MNILYCEPKGYEYQVLGVFFGNIGTDTMHITTSHDITEHEARPVHLIPSADAVTVSTCTHYITMIINSKKKSNSTLKLELHGWLVSDPV